MKSRWNLVKRVRQYDTGYYTGYYTPLEREKNMSQVRGPRSPGAHTSMSDEDLGLYSSPHSVPLFRILASVICRFVYICSISVTLSTTLPHSFITTVLLLISRQLVARRRPLHSFQTHPDGHIIDNDQLDRNPFHTHLHRLGTGELKKNLLAFPYATLTHKLASRPIP